MLGFVLINRKKSFKIYFAPNEENNRKDSGESGKELIDHKKNNWTYSFFILAVGKYQFGRDRLIHLLQHVSCQMVCCLRL